MSSMALLFVTVPLITALIGWITNWAAVKMIFYPQKFRGIGPIGWQGILPRNATGFALDVAQTLTEKLVSPRELAKRLDPAEMEKLLEDSLESESDEIVRDAAERLQRGAWDQLPAPTRAMIVGQVRQETKQVARDIFDRLQGISDELLDLRALVVSELSGRNTGKLVRLFQEIGARELRFIEYYGGVFGFFIGLGQVAAWSWLQVWWIMPIVGVIVGLVTNYLAIQMIFRPLERTRYLGVPYQGMFPKRQLEISKDYARITADEVLTAKNLIRLVAEGEAGERIAEVVVTTISERLVEISAKAQALVPVEITPAMIDEVKAVVVERLQRSIPDFQPQLEEYLDRKLDIGTTIETKLSRLSKHEFERILRGLFEKDEFMLIVIGGVLGGAVGCLQALLVVTL
ncbi:MAG TPA: DUF445 family protein [Kofleriaceae bacterium]|nr:DUF445 family protein [Kofleriaceae bacterium]